MTYGESGYKQLQISYSNTPPNVLSIRLQLLLCTQKKRIVPRTSIPVSETTLSPEVHLSLPVNKINLPPVPLFDFAVYGIEVYR